MVKSEIFFQSNKLNNQPLV